MSPHLRLLLAIAGLILLAAAPARAHEVRPGYLEVEEGEPGHYEITWKMPLMGGMRLRLEPLFPADCVKGETRVVSLTASAVVEAWPLACEAPLRDRTIAIGGLEPTLTDVFLRVLFADGKAFSTVLRPAAPSAAVTGAHGKAVTAYLGLGVRHILFGLDHILFVIGLMFIVRGLGPLVKTITAFTVAHSLTLGLSAFGVVRLSQTPVDAAVALSILFLAAELARSRGHPADTLTFRHPWAVAFAFGLVHGVGFASALQEVGLPEGAALAALFLFNIGVELGQLAIVGAFLLQLTLSRSLLARLPEAVRLAPVYAMGVIAAYWLIERLARMV